MSVAKVMFMKEKNVSFQFGMKNIGCDTSWKELKTAVLTLATTSPLTIFSNLVPLQVFYRVSVYFLEILKCNFIGTCCDCSGSCYSLHFAYSHVW